MDGNNSADLMTFVKITCDEHEKGFLAQCLVRSVIVIIKLVTNNDQSSWT